MIILYGNSGAAQFLWEPVLDKSHRTVQTRRGNGDNKDPSHRLPVESKLKAISASFSLTFSLFRKKSPNQVVAKSKSFPYYHGKIKLFIAFEFGVNLEKHQKGIDFELISSKSLNCSVPSLVSQYPH